MANKLKKYISSKIGEESKFILVGFSMGGIISRYYLQNLGVINRVEKFFAISAPHKGSFAAYFFFGKRVKQLRPGSQFLNQLNKNENILKSLELYSYYTPFDLSVFPYTNSKWNIAKNKKFYSFLHFYMIYNKNVADEILMQINNY